MLDLAKTMLQETGQCAASGLTVAEIVEIATDLGLDPNKLRVVGQGDGVLLQVTK